MILRSNDMVITPDNPMAIRGIRRAVPKIAVPLADLVEYWGARCEEYEHGCPTCTAWKLFDASFVVPSDDDVFKEMNNGI
jgi:hypothetical protein